MGGVLGLEHRKAELQQVGPCDASGDDPARFLRELRQLRIEAGLSHAGLAARAHYPCDVVRAAEAGPSLPGLPVLSAYVRACGGVPSEWEDRWRSLTRTPTLTLLPVRHAGGSEAATAGARAGAAIPACDGHDPALIMTALGKAADGTAADSPSSPSPAPATTVAERGMAGTAGGMAGTAARAPEPPPGAAAPGGRAARGPATSPSAAPLPDTAAAPGRLLPPRGMVVALAVLLCLVVAGIAVFA